MAIKRSFSPPEVLVLKVVCVSLHTVCATERKTGSMIPQMACLSMLTATHDPLLTPPIA